MTSTSRDAAWHAALAYALVGREIDLPVGVRLAPEVLVEQLDAAGWGPARIAEHALACRDAERPWPHRVPDALRAGLGAAQFQAALGRVRELLGVDVLDARGPSTRTALTADERRLLADVPPHHVPR